jgi:hypothetical protein
MKEQGPADPPSSAGRTRLWGLARFGVRALRVSASTIAVVALLRQNWIPATAFAIAWVLILQAPRLFPLLAEVEEA